MARSFNGTSDLITIPNGSYLDFSSSTLSVQAWIKTTAINAVVISTLGSSNFNGFEFGLGQGVTAGHIAIYNGSGWVGSTSAANDGNWHHVAATNDGTTTSFFLDGVANGTAAQSKPNTSVQAMFQIGQRPGGSGRFPGSLAEVVVWKNAVLVANEWAGAKLYGARVRPTSTSAYWPLWGLSSPEPDLSGSQNNGTLTGTAYTNGPPVTLFTRKSRTPPDIYTPPVSSRSSNLLLMGCG